MVLAKSKIPEKEKKPLSKFEQEFDTKDPSGVVKKIEQRCRVAFKHEHAWQEEADEDFKFALGDQWTTEERNVLKEQGRPCLTFNKIEPLIDLVGGWERENSMRIRVFPEGGEDKIFSEIGDRCLKAIDKWTKLNYKLDHQFDDGVICGKGWIEMAITYDEDPINGDLIFRNVPYYQILKDPDGREYDRSDWKYMIKFSKLSRNELKKLFPKKESDIDGMTSDNLDYMTMGEVFKEGDKDNYHLGKETQEVSEFTAVGDGAEEREDKFMLKEYYYREYVSKFYVYDPNDEKLYTFDKKDEAETKKAAILAEREANFQKATEEYAQLRTVSQTAQMAVGQVAPLPEPPMKDDSEIKIVQGSKSEMKYAATVAGVLLQEPTHSPLFPNYNDFPFFNFFAKWYISSRDERLSIKGVTRNVKDPNRELNKSRSQFLHIINTSANSGWIGDRDALTQEQWKDLEQMGSTPGVVIKKKTGTTLQRIEPAGMSMANLTRGEKSEQDIKEISGINSDAMAIQDKTTSGRAISMRIRQAMTILAKYFRNFRWTKEMIGTAIFSMIPTVFDVPTIRKVLGAEFIKVNGVSDGVIQSFLVQIEDGKYDINITEADNSLTIRQETFDELMELAKGGYPIPPDVILEFSSMPNSKEIITRVQEYMQKQQANATGAKAPGQV